MSAFVRPEAGRPFVYGHRGTRRAAPENTLRAMRWALTRGADGIELDVRLCGSGEVVVVHDPDLQRVAGARLSVAELGLSQLRRYDVGEGERVPLLEEAMQLVLGARKLLNIELKADVPDPAALVAGVVSCLVARSDAERELCVLSSFSSALCSALVRALPEQAVGLLFERGPLELPVGITAVHPHQSLALPSLAGYRAASLAVNVWTVNDPERALELARAGVDGIITDDVPAVLDVLEALTGESRES